MSGIYISSGAFRGGRLVEMADACDALGVGLELSSGMRWHAGLKAEIERSDRPQEPAPRPQLLPPAGKTVRPQPRVVGFADP